MKKSIIKKALSALLIVMTVLSLFSCKNESADTTAPKQEDLVYDEYSECDSYEVYVWPMAANSFRCKILPGTHRKKTEAELMGKTLKNSMSVEETKKELDNFGVSDDKIKIYAYASSISSYRCDYDDAYMKKLSSLFDDRYECTVYDDSFNIKAVPDDFEFSLSFGINGFSSYDSRTHTLIKTRDTDDISKFTAELVFDEVDKSLIYNLLVQCIDLSYYPENYDPYNAPDAKLKVHTTPESKLSLFVKANGKTYSINCDNLAYSAPEKCYSEEAAKFIEVINEIKEMITSSKEWNNLPESEKHYM